ncbi:MAG: tellurite resistance TerB family protein [Geminicoccaceae bacterium]
MSTIDPHAALVYTMMIVSAAEGEISDKELDAIGRLVRHLPVFQGFDPERLIPLGSDCAELLRREDGLDQALEQIRDGLPPKLRDTAYALACDVAAADNKVTQEELRLLEMLRHQIGVERLTAAAIEKAAGARFARL